MRDLATSIVIGKNKLDRSAPWLSAIEIDLPSPDGPLYYVNASDSVHWGAAAPRREYVSAFFEPDILSFGTDGELPEIGLRIFNTKHLAYLLKEYSGFENIDLTLSYIYPEKTGDTWYFNHAIDTYALRFPFIVNHADVNGPFIEVVLGVEDYYQIQIPGRKYRRKWCSFAYQEDWCWMKDYTEVSGEPTSCQHTLAACVEHWEFQDEPTVGVPFGGFPTVGTGAYRY